jgi:4-carboxymuconolactone decarboxylase
MAILPDPTAKLTGEDRVIYEDMLARRKAKGVDHLGPYVPLLSYPQLAKRVEALGYFVKYQSVLPRTIYQFVVLLIAKRSGVAFVWEDHIAAARAAGLPEPVIQSISSGATEFAFPYDMALQTTTYAFACQSIPEDLQNRLIAEFGIQGLLEIVTLCGFYSLMSMINGCFDVTEPGGGGN